MIGINSALGAANVVSPAHKTKSVWIDANDFAVQTFASGATIAHKGNPAITFVTVGATLEVKLDVSGNKEFEFNGSFIRCNSGVADFLTYHRGLSPYVVQVIAKFGTTSNPDAIYAICGNNGGASTTIGFCLFADNRTVTSAGIRGYAQSITNSVISAPVFDSRFNNGAYSVEQSLYFVLETGKIIDENYLVKDADIVSLQDVKRSAVNTTTGLGAARVHSASNPTYAFEIGALGNGVIPLAAGTTMKQFIIYDEILNGYDIRDIDAFFGYYFSRGNTTMRSGRTRYMIIDDYILGGLYAKNADRSKTTLVTSRGPDHFGVGSDRDGVQITSTEDAFAWPSAFSTVFTDATDGIHVPYGGYSPAGTLIALYSKFTSATGVFTQLVARRSTDGGTTWGSEINITLPVTSPVLTAWVVHDELVACNNGDIAIPMYAVSTTALYNLYIVRSTDDGLTWAFTLVYTSGSAYLNESSVAWLGGNNWIIWSRVEVVVGAVFVYRQFFSNDDLATFADQGVTPFGGALFAHPPMLRSYLIDGTRVVEATWVNRDTRRMHAKYALASAIVTNGISEWTAKTTYTVIQRLQGTTGGWESGYPFMIHSRGDLNMEGVWFEENSTTETRVAIMFYNDQLKAAIKTELGL